MSRGHGAMALAIATLCTVSAAACEDERPPPTFRVTFTARSDDDPLAGVQVIADGQPLGETGPDGTLRTDLTGREGQSVAVNAQCPEGHRAPEPLPLLTLRSFRGLDPAAAERGIEMTISCPPAERTAAVVIRTGDEGGDLPVLMGGREVTRTDESGVAHLVMQLRPHSTFRLQIDTSDRENLRPQNPGATFTVPDADEIFLYDQPFQVKRKRRRWHRRRREPETSTPMLPMRIE